MANYTTTSQPLPYQVPYLQDYWGRAQDVANQPYQQSPGTYAAPNPYMQQAWDATANRAMQGSPVMGAANGQLQNIISGGMMNSNPYLDQQVTAATGDITNAWNNVAKPQWDTAMLKSGSFGNTGVQQSYGNAADSLQRNIGRTAGDMRSNAYNTERNYMQQALGMAPSFANQDYVDANALMGVGSSMQGFNNAAQAQNQQWFQDAQAFPQQQLDAYGRALGVGGGTQQTTTQPDPSTLSQVVGGGLAGMSIWDMLFNKKPGG